jgi:ribosomal protein L31
MKKGLHPFSKRRNVINTKGALFKTQRILKMDNILLNIDPTNHVLWTSDKLLLNLKDKGRVSEFNRRFESIL